MAKTTTPNKWGVIFVRLQEKCGSKCRMLSNQRKSWDKRKEKRGNKKKWIEGGRVKKGLSKTL